jgi:phi13 family phage major tail protein
MAKIGVSNLHYAILTSDEADSTPVYDTPVSVAGVTTLNVNPNASVSTLFADDGPYESATTLGQVEVSIDLADLTLAVQAALLGHTLTSGVMYRKSTDTPPYVAIGFKSLKANGNYRYTWLTKGKFALSEQNHETRGESINFQPEQIMGAFVKRLYDDEWERHVDQDNDDWEAAYGTDWFNGPTAVG